MLRQTDPGRTASLPHARRVGDRALAMIGCLVLYFSLPLTAILVLPVWGAIGLLVYFLYSRSRSHVGRGIIDKMQEDNPPIHGVKM